MTVVIDDAAAILENEVRELVRRRGIDPSRERAALDRLVGEAVADYTERTARGLVPPLADTAEVARGVVDALAGLGPLQQYLDDPTVEEIWLNGPAQVFVARGGVPELTTTLLTGQQVRDLVERMLKSTGRRLDLSSPFVDASLPDGSRLHVVIPDVTRSEYAVNIRKHVVRASRLDHLVRLGSLTPHAAAFLDAAVRAGLNILVAGATQSGKTTMLNALAGSIPASQRVITCEEVFELTVADRIPTCERSSTPACPSTEPARAPLSHVSSKMHATSRTGAAGPSSPSTPTTTRAHRARRSAPASMRCSLTSPRAAQTS